MKIYELNESYGVYYSAPDRIVKKVEEDVYETYRITVVDNMRTITINTVKFKEINSDEIDRRLSDCGLVYDRENKQIVQKHDPTKVLEDDTKKLPYVVADRISYSGYVNDAITYQFENVLELNEILLEHDIPIKYKSSTLEEI